MTRLVRGPAVALPILPLCFGQPPRLPVKRVVLYKNGVGYFEHVGQVRGNQEVTIPFTSGQLNDVLKSLTVLDLGGGRITGVAYGSTAPVDRQLGDLRLPVNEQETRLERLGKEMEQIQKEMDAAQEVLDRMIRDLTVDAAV